MKRFLKFIVRWYKIIFLGYYNPCLYDSKGMRYVILPNREIRRVDEKREFRANRKRERKIKDMKEFFDLRGDIDENM